MKLINWIKSNLLSIIAIVLVVYLLTRPPLGIFSDDSSIGYQKSTATSSFGSSINYGTGDSRNMGYGKRTEGAPSSVGEYPPQTATADRLVIKESSLSLLVVNVTEIRQKIISHAQSVGGYMVSASTTNPDNQASAVVIVRVPAEKLEETLNVYRSFGIRVVSENLYGYDVTDQYVDIEKRISQYEKTLKRYEDLLDRATLVADITNITQQILSTQSQIDSLKGQQNALTQNAKLAKLTIYLSTDEIALPYTPDEAFRPQVIFKNATRSMIGTLRNIAEFAIWAGVYAVIWVPALLIFIVVKKLWQKRPK
ncbi:MAG: DUF4349 domain-containing protein [Patescibacteria group bacterium]|nr:DUF4349 domain-containing protein [Patescibacteria group bacterium]